MRDDYIDVSDYSEREDSDNIELARKELQRPYSRKQKPQSDSTKRQMALRDVKFNVLNLCLANNYSPILEIIKIAKDEGEDPRLRFLAHTTLLNKIVPNATPRKDKAEEIFNDMDEIKKRMDSYLLKFKSEV